MGQISAVSTVVFSHLVGITVMANKGKTNSQQHHRSNTLWELEGMYAAKSRLSPTEVKGLFYLLKTFACKNQRSFFIKCIGFWFVGCHCSNFVSVYVYLVLSFKQLIRLLYFEDVGDVGGGSGMFLTLLILLAVYYQSNIICKFY